MNKFILVLLLVFPLLGFSQSYFSNISFGTRNAATIQVAIDNQNINYQALSFVRITNLQSGYHQLSILVIAADGKMGNFKTQLLIESNFEYTYVLDMANSTSFNFYNVDRQSLTPHTIGISQKINNNTSLYYSENNLINYYQNNVPSFDMLKLESTPPKVVQYSQIATDSIITQFCDIISRKGFDDDKQTMAKLCINSYSLTTFQLIKITKLLEFDATKLQFIKNAATHISDKYNLYLLENEVKSSNSVLVLQRYLQLISN